MLTLSTNALTITHHAAHDDFDGNGDSDILWRNDSGLITEWLGNTSQTFVPNSAATTGAADSSWHIVGTGDFNGDGRVDILWRNDSGLLTVWNSAPDGSFATSANATTGAADTSWHVVGVGDFNGDLIDDILWRNSGGLLTEWLGNPNQSDTFVPNALATTGAADNTWQVVGVGDFNGDHREDILWRNTNGLLTDWLANTDGSFTPNTVATIGAADTSWHVVGVGDFDRSRSADILWRNTNGIVTDWLSNSDGSFSPNPGATTGAADNSWHVVSVADFSGTGDYGILWRNDNGLLTEWASSGGSFSPLSSATSGAADTSWHVVDPSVNFF